MSSASAATSACSRSCLGCARGRSTASWPPAHCPSTPGHRRCRWPPMPVAANAHMISGPGGRCGAARREPDRCSRRAVAATGRCPRPAASNSTARCPPRRARRRAGHRPSAVASSSWRGCRCRCRYRWPWPSGRAAAPPAVAVWRAPRDPPTPPPVRRRCPGRNPHEGVAARADSLPTAIPTVQDTPGVRQRRPEQRMGRTAAHPAPVPSGRCAQTGGAGPRWMGRNRAVSRRRAGR
jgi:hypothetical protein